MVVDAVLHPDPGVILSERGGRKPEYFDAAVRDRGGETNRVEHSATTKDRHKRLTTNVLGMNGTEDRFNHSRVVLGHFAAGNHETWSPFKSTGVRVEERLHPRPTCGVGGVKSTIKDGQDSMAALGKQIDPPVRLWTEGVITEDHNMTSWDLQIALEQTRTHDEAPAFLASS